MQSQDKIALKIIFQMTLIFGILEVVSLVFFLPLIEPIWQVAHLPLLIYGTGLLIFSSPFIFVFSIWPLIKSLNTAQQEVQDSASEKNKALAAQSKSLKEAYQHSLKKLKDQEERYALAVKGAKEGLWDWNIQDNTLYLSDIWNEILGYGKGEFPASFESWKLSVHPEDLDYFESTLNECMNGNSDRLECEYRMRKRNNSYMWVLIQGSCLHNKAGKVIRIVGSQTDISSKKKFEEQLYHDAFHDVLTGLPNRALFLDRLNQSVLANLRNQESSYSVLFLDLDYFKNVNDNFGHAAGDTLICEVARRIQDVCRKSDTLARFGGDEFVLLLLGLTKTEDIKHFLSTLQRAVNEPVVFDNGTFHPSCTIGIVSDTKNYTSAEDVLRDADFALYKAKEKQRGTFGFFNKKTKKAAAIQFRMETNLQKALTRNEIFVFYEPLCSLKDQSLLGFEALLRWNHPDYGYVTPELFIPIAEENETIFTLSEFLIEQSLKQLKIWQDAFSRPDLTIALNISHRQIENERLYITLESALSLYDLDPKTIIVDLTENAIFNNRDKAHWYLKAMQKIGMRIALDDFGTGYSSLSALNSYPFDIIKVDKSFLLDLSKNSKFGLHMIDVMATLGHKMNKQVFIEGIETRDLFQKVSPFQCDYGQGHYFGKPKDKDETTAFLKEKHRLFAEGLLLNPSGAG